MAELNPDKRISNFVNMFSNNPVQGTDKWLKAREKQIGGSEMAALIGKNPYLSFNKLVGQKCNIEHKSFGLACWWGSMFETISERIVEIDCGTKIIGNNIFINGDKFGFTGFSNSPDGYCCLTLVKDDDDDDDDDVDVHIKFTDDKDNNKKKERTAIVLLELKAPFTRIPTETIPKQYLPQVLSGLQLSPIAEFGLFVDVVYRVCSLSDMGPSEMYNREFHRNDTFNWDSIPLAWGVIGVYAPVNNQVANNISYLYFGIQPVSNVINPVDFGDCNLDIFTNMMSCVNSGMFIIDHGYPKFSDGRGKNIKFPNSYLSDYYLVGLIPWKVLEINYIPVCKSIGFLKSHESKMKKLFSLVDTIKSSSNSKDEYDKLINSRKRKTTTKGGELNMDIDNKNIEDLFNWMNE